MPDEWRLFNLKSEAFGEDADQERGYNEKHGADHPSYWCRIDFSDSAGQTSFEVSNGSDVVVNASLDFENVSPTNAINAMDALQALRIAVGLETSNGPATYEDYIASDFDASGSVNAMDALGILKYAVGLDAPDARWVFIDSDGDYSDVTQSSVTYDTGISLEAFAADASVSLTGILVGDIDDSYSGLIA